MSHHFKLFDTLLLLKWLDLSLVDLSGGFDHLAIRLADECNLAIVHTTVIGIPQALVVGLRVGRCGILERLT